jgi:hypothetical protein
MDKDQTVIGSDDNPVAASTQARNRSRRRLWRYNGALAPMRAKATRQAHDRRAPGSPRGRGSRDSHPAGSAGVRGSARASAARRRAWLMS